ncbi:MAG: class I SAM-dependent methyltransferase, partial [Acidobacteria bacterium]|nr:class I SAM-dependent methyltransferase [Acidobacteriota bacterium]
MAASPEVVRAARLQNLEDEQVGVRHRMEHFYLPLFQQFCQERGLQPGCVRVLDCGCGNGLSVECLAEAGFAACGIDLWAVRLEQWKERSRLPRAGFLFADATRLPFAPASFDIVLSCGLLEHIGVAEEWEPVYKVAPLADQAERRRQFLVECFRVMRPGGVLYLDHPNGAFPIDFWHNSYRTEPRFHSLSEGFLPTFREVATLARQADPACRVEAVSP